MVILDLAKRRGESCVLLFADAEKCFDHLWLEDCLVDLNEAGMKEREILILFKINEKTRMQVDTPLGKTKEINLERIVKQGTVYGPQLCCASTDKINGMEYDSTTVVAPAVEMKSMIFVDDFFDGGSTEVVERAGRNLNKMEETKGFTFNVGEAKTQYMIVNTGKEKIKKPD